MIQAYFMFDAMSRKGHSFRCHQCGYYPVVMNFDVNRKASFRLPKIPIDPGKTYSDTVNMKEFWDTIFMSAIAEGVFHGKRNPFQISPSFEFWAPWIEPMMLKDPNMCVNTEYKKLSDSSLDTGSSVLNSLNSETLEDLLWSGTGDQLKELCKKCNITQNCGTKLDMILALKSVIASNAEVDKFFYRIFHASGGAATGTCPHGVCQAIKWLLRAESPRDPDDLLLAMNHRPNIVLSDNPHMLASHVNRRSTDFFHPHGGRVCSAEVASNVDNAHAGTLEKISFPWFENINKPCLERYYTEIPRANDCHPATLVTKCYSLC